ncbi:DUF2075 domain-containing protein [Loigolactobacillus jiayinensis]|mgnify:CR=1 FL=1|uniref:DNA/RNA helicase domain-containing protein n=1 Tax=Loigolactobacillus jiayinensis TaxID=2486016 RepID=A0ABW1RIL6_9LACO|nr:DUF2075 domain-containing protein [Loigolactobacillus jiayinensis]
MLENTATSKLAPETELSPQQKKLTQQALTFCAEHLASQQPGVFVIKGAAGTGKSVVLSALMATLQQARTAAQSPFYQTNNYLLVNHPEMLKTYKQIAADQPNLRKKDFMKPTPFINQMAKQATTADIVLVDEAHLLLTKSDRYNRFNQENQLTEICNHSRIVILVFDEHQVLKMKSYWNQTKLMALLAKRSYKIVQLDQQFRVHANSATQHWLTALGTKGQLLPRPADSTFDLRIFADASQMYQQLRHRDHEFGLSRLVATADFPYKLDGQTYYVIAPSFKLPWDKNMDPNITWAERPETLNEVGSIYTIQGFDLNYVAVILGPSVTYDPTAQRLKLLPDNYQDHEAFKRRADLTEPQAWQAKQQIILNSINVLLQRGRYGLYLYATDPQLRAKLLTL